MDTQLAVILFTILLIDSMGAILVAWFAQKWWHDLLPSFTKYFPPAKGWAILYFVLVLMLGYSLGLLK